ncbi:hypothetical protein DEO72_LG9g565 [Vigna unguiculata]|uniref:Uncharacterized protein n=1 Tax=Vigna unguiculata TaxID=3917 RepID=A0A4D6MY24_VIGUN|nr:hypothetical protein DEO72_LG9g565 [Vigna unguiculata]
MIGSILDSDVGLAVEERYVFLPFSRRTTRAGIHCHLGFLVLSDIVAGAVEGEGDVETRGDEEPAVVGGVAVEAAGEGEGDMEAAVAVEHVGAEVGEALADKGEGEVEVEHDEEPAVVGGVEVEAAGEGLLKNNIMY